MSNRCSRLVSRSPALQYPTSQNEGYAILPENINMYYTCESVLVFDAGECVGGNCDLTSSTLLPIVGDV